MRGSRLCTRLGLEDDGDNDAVDGHRFAEDDAAEQAGAARELCNALLLLLLRPMLRT
jgi:hypothetical protein